MQTVAVIDYGMGNLHSVAKALEHVVGRSPIMRLSFGQLEADGQAERIDQGMDFGGQAAARATHATGSAIFFWALAPCWRTRIDELSIIWMSPA